MVVEEDKEGEEEANKEEQEGGKGGGGKEEETGVHTKPQKHAETTYNIYGNLQHRHQLYPTIAIISMAILRPLPRPSSSDAFVRILSPYPATHLM